MDDAFALDKSNVNNVACNCLSTKAFLFIHFSEQKPAELDTPGQLVPSNFNPEVLNPLFIKLFRRAKVNNSDKSRVEKVSSFLSFW